MTVRSWVSPGSALWQASTAHHESSTETMDPSAAEDGRYTAEYHRRLWQETFWIRRRKWGRVTGEEWSGRECRACRHAARPPPRDWSWSRSCRARSGVEGYRFRHVSLPRSGECLSLFSFALDPTEEPDIDWISVRSCPKPTIRPYQSIPFACGFWARYGSWSVREWISSSRYDIPPCTSCPLWQSYWHIPWELH